MISEIYFLIAKGNAKKKYEEMRTRIIQCLATVEALIDFGEGEDIEEGVYLEGVFPIYYIKIR